MLPEAIEMFQELAALPRHVAYLAYWNPKREKFDKVPHDGARKLSTADPTHWGPMLEVAQAATGRGLSGIGLVFTGGIEVAGETLVGFDFDDVVGPIKLLEVLDTYSEISPSRTGKRAFVWLPSEVLAGYRDNTEAHPSGCDHCEIYFGTAARFLTLTFHPDGAVKPIAHLTQDHPAVAELQGLLKRKEDDSEAPAPVITGDGTLIDLEALEPGRNAEDRELIGKLLAGAGQPEINRSDVVHKLLVWLIDSVSPVFSPEDIFATLTQHPALWLYLLDHRNNKPERAMQFANEELARAYKKSTTGKLAALFANPAWKVVDVLEVEEKDPDSPTTPLCESLPDFLADDEPLHWQIEGILAKGKHNALLGHPNAGKTTCALDMKLHLAFGMDFAGHTTVRSREVYLAGEDSGGIRRRIKLWCQQHHKNIKDLDGWFFVIREPVLDDPEQVAKLLMELATIQPDSLTIDTFSANYGGESEDKATEVKKWMKLIRQDFIGRFGCSVLTLHHPPKGSDDIHNWRGSGAAAGDLDNIFGMAKLGDKIRLSLGKHRDAQFDPILWQIETAPIKGTRNNLGKPETSVMATLTEHCNDMAATKICRAIEVFRQRGGKFSREDIANLAGLPKSSVIWQVGRLQIKDGTRARMVIEKDGRLDLTKAGKAAAEWAQIDLEMTERIRAVLGDFDEDSE